MVIDFQKKKNQKLLTLLKKIIKRYVRWHISLIGLKHYMEIFLVILAFLIVLFILFCLTDIKVYAEFDNVSSCNLLKLKAYIFSGLLVFRLKREIKSEGKKQSIKDKITMVIN